MTDPCSLLTNARIFGTSPSPHQPEPLTDNIRDGAATEGLPELQLTGSWEGFGAAVTAIAVDEERGQIVTACRDGIIRLHSLTGENLAE